MINDGHIRLIVALDVEDTAHAQTIANALDGLPVGYKIGYRLLARGGFLMAQKLAKEGRFVFLDVKYHDIENTVMHATRSLCALNAQMMSVHADPGTLRGAVAGRGKNTNLLILAVCVLTSLNQADLNRICINMPLEKVMLKRAGLALSLGADGVIASAREAPALRAAFGKKLLIVTPGIRPEGCDPGDQKRVMTPAGALRAGADSLVVGRPITASSDPRAACIALLHSINAL